MSDEDKTAKSAGGFLGSIFPFLPAEMRGTIGGMLMFVLFFAMMYAIVNMPTFFRNLAASPGKTGEYCWELKEIQGAVFKFNRCTGEATQLELKKGPQGVVKDPATDRK